MTVACTSWAKCSKCCPRRASTCPSTRRRSSHFTINPEKIGEVVGPRGKTINKIIEDTGVKIDIEDDGSVYIATEDAEAAKRARPDHRRHRA